MDWKRKNDKNERPQPLLRLGAYTLWAGDYSSSRDGSSVRERIS